MEITKENFAQELPGVIASIKQADFVSFDCEFSGIGEGSHMILPFDTPTSIYHKAKENLCSYTVVQFGLCTFRYDAIKKKFLYRVFNFYVFPRLPERLSRTLRKYSTSFQNFTCQADSLQFLASQQFDFNKWIYNGVGFLRESVLDYLKEEIRKKYSWRLKSDKKVAPSLPKVPDAHKAKLEKAVKSVGAFVTDGNERSMCLEGLSGHEKRMLTATLENKYGLSLYFNNKQKDDGVYVLTIIKCDDIDDYRKHLQAQMNADLSEMDEAAGFCQVIEAISKSKKILVGHNMYLDVLQTLKTFCSDLPDNYTDFKILLNDSFPKLIDTKVIAMQPTLKKSVGLSNSLFELHKRIGQPPFTPCFIEAEDLMYSYENKSNQHEAGYDAFITGSCFISMADFWGYSNNKCQRISFDIPWDLMSPLVNKISPGRIIDMTGFNVSLSKDADVCPDRSHVFHMSFPAESLNSELLQELFSPYGLISVYWVDNESCFVALRDRRQANFVLTNLLSENEERQWKIVTANDFLKSQENTRLKRDATSSDVLGLKKMKLDCQEF